MKRLTLLIFLLLTGFLLTGCIRVVSDDAPREAAPRAEEPRHEEPRPEEHRPEDEVPPEDPVRSKRPKYQPGELVDYTCGDGDTVEMLAARFNTTEEEIREANPVLPEKTTTLPQGLPLQIPIYYRIGWGSSYKMIPDALYVNGPDQKGFTARSYTDRQPGWFKYYNSYSDNKNQRGGELIDYIANSYSISPRLLLALLEYISHALTDPNYRDDFNEISVFGFEGAKYRTLGGQLNQLADFLNERYYQYKAGKFIEYELQDGSLIRNDPWQNAATVALQAYFAKVLPPEKYYEAIGPNGFVKTYKEMFGDFGDVDAYPAHLPGSLEQNKMRLPFKDGEAWTYTGGPHTAWGSNPPYSAIDFAPPAKEHGCFTSNAEVIAPADGNIVRTDTGMAMFDMDDDMDEHTGWVLLMLHLKTESIPPVGTHLNEGDFIGHPSCDGGTSSGTHVHIARKYNGEWIPAGGVIPMNFDDWIVEDGDDSYTGYLRRYSTYVVASETSEYFSRVLAGPPVYPTPTATPVKK